MIYKSSLDTRSKLITWGCSILFALIITYQMTHYLSNRRVISLFVIAFLIVVYGIVYMVSPLFYEVTGEGIIVHRIFKNVTIPGDNLVSCELMDEGKISGSIRLFGSGGFFGYFGLFSNASLGKMRWYSRRSKPSILISTKNGIPILLSPDKPGEFIAQIAEVKSQYWSEK